MTKSRRTGSRSRKVYLRHPEAGDFEELAERYRTSRKHLRGVVSTGYDRAKFDQMLVDSARDTNAYFVICRAADDAIVGLINLSQIFRKSFQNAYLGYQLFQGYTGHGYMTEAVETILTYAFTELGLHRIEANVQPTNAGSIRVLRRTGFTKEGFSRRYLKIGGRWRDHQRWAIIKDDWKQN